MTGYDVVYDFLHRIISHRIVCVHIVCLDQLAMLVFYFIFFFFYSSVYFVLRLNVKSDYYINFANKVNESNVFYIHMRNVQC